MKRSNEIDITLTEDGDFVLVDGDFVLAYDMEYIKQQIFHRIKTMNPDWFYDKIGADLEQLLGKAKYPRDRNTRDRFNKRSSYKWWLYRCRKYLCKTNPCQQ